MADYYPLIARAIAGLDPSAPGESRRALYERARAALIAQLRSVQPPLSESEITRERLSLEEAVRKVESEAAQRARDASRSGGDRARAGDAFRANTRPNARPGDGAPPSASQASRPRPPSQPASRNERPPLGQEDRQDQRPQRNLRADAPPPSRPQPPSSQPQVPMQDPQLPPTPERTGAPTPRPPTPKPRCRTRSCRRPASARARRAAAPTTAPRKPRACAASAT